MAAVAEVRTAVAVADSTAAAEKEWVDMAARAAWYLAEARPTVARVLPTQETTHAVARWSLAVI